MLSGIFLPTFSLFTTADGHVRTASSYAYDKDNRLTKATEGAISANYAYDSFSRMTGLTAKNGVPLTTKMPHI